jgi:hypothetical protein
LGAWDLNDLSGLFRRTLGNHQIAPGGGLGRVLRTWWMGARSDFLLPIDDDFLGYATRCEPGGPLRHAARGVPELLLTLHVLQPAEAQGSRQTSYVRE